MLGIRSRSFCVTATRTVMTEAAGPLIRTLTIGPSNESRSSAPPPVPTKYGRISLSTVSTFSSVALSQLAAGGTAAERTAKATEETSRNTKRIAERVGEGRFD